MIKRLAKFGFGFTFSFCFAFVQASPSSDPRSDDQLVNSLVRQKVDLINRIIRNPAEASMENWKITSNPNDETEEAFYMNSISDGGLSAFSEGSPTMEKFTKHFTSLATKEPSVALQYLRLSLMMYNERTGPPPYFVIKSYDRVDPTLIVVYCDFVFVDYRGESDKKYAKIFFSSETDNIKVIMTLSTICIEGDVVYGWWHSGSEKYCQ